MKRTKDKYFSGATYWIVVGQTPAEIPVRHLKFEHACMEARKLANKFPARVFSVFKLKFSAVQEKAPEVVEGNRESQGATAGVENAVATT